MVQSKACVQVDRQEERRRIVHSICHDARTCAFLVIIRSNP